MKAVSGKHLCTILARHGWMLKRVRGSHHIYTKAKQPTIISVPVHGNQDLKIGMLKRLLKEAGLTEQDL